MAEKELAMLNSSLYLDVPTSIGTGTSYVPGPPTSRHRLVYPDASSIRLRSLNNKSKLSWNITSVDVKLGLAKDVIHTFLHNPINIYTRSKKNLFAVVDTTCGHDYYNNSSLITCSTDIIDIPVTLYCLKSNIYLFNTYKTSRVNYIDIYTVIKSLSVNSTSIKLDKSTLQDMYKSMVDNNATALDILKSAWLALKSIYSSLDTTFNDLDEFYSKLYNIDEYPELLCLLRELAYSDFSYSDLLHYYKRVSKNNIYFSDKYAATSVDRCTLHGIFPLHTYLHKDSHGIIYDECVYKALSHFVRLPMSSFLTHRLDNVDIALLSEKLTLVFLRRNIAKIYWYLRDAKAKSTLNEDTTNIFLYIIMSHIHSILIYINSFLDYEAPSNVYYTILAINKNINNVNILNRNFTILNVLNMYSEYLILHISTSIAKSSGLMGTGSSYDVNLLSVDTRSIFENTQVYDSLGSFISSKYLGGSFNLYKAINSVSKIIFKNYTK